MSDAISEIRNPGCSHHFWENHIPRTGRLQHQPDDDFEGKEFYSGVELDGPTIPRDGQFSETSKNIAPEVVSTNISHQDGSSFNVTDKSQAAELATEKGIEQERGRKPRGIGTWKGMSRTVRNTLIVVLVLMILALVGILLGVFLGRRHSISAPAAGQYDILGTSKLSALTFQNGNNDTDKNVFFQLSESLAIMRARWNSTTTGWTFENISQAMIDGGSSIYPKAGTPLVAVAPDAVEPADLSNFWVDLYFMSLSNMPYQIWSWSVPQTDPSKDQLWHQESLQNYQGIFTTGFARGTQLAAYRDRCAANCSDNTRLLYQGANGDLMLGSSPVRSWQDWNVADLSGVDSPTLPALEMNSSIAMTRYSPAQGGGPSGMRMYYDVSHTLEEYVLVNGSWTNSMSLHITEGKSFQTADTILRKFRGIPRRAEHPAGRQRCHVRKRDGWESRQDPSYHPVRQRHSGSPLAGGRRRALACGFRSTNECDGPRHQPSPKGIQPV